MLALISCRSDVKVFSLTGRIRILQLQATHSESRQEEGGRMAVTSHLPLFEERESFPRNPLISQEVPLATAR